MRTPVSHGNVDRLVAVAIDKDKSSHIALKWAIDNVVAKGQALTLIHVKPKQSLPGLNQISDASIEVGDDIKVKEFSILNMCKDRFKTEDNIPGSVMKRVPDFCSVYVINKGKISSSRAASSPPPSFSNPLILARGGLFTGQSRPGSEPSLLAKQNEANFIKSFLEQQQRMDMELKESMEKLEQEWRQTMEKLERDRLAMEQAWEDREEERRLREEKRDALLTALLNKR
ncbi:hypothetical protein ACJIZ3_001772 [Penstemon smallii]|uniref:RING-type E3 ubiquitin transferase n=1 Tax=Penstemon smallii TaxID=265156 RepID=A0ABD3U4J6_9LAMI